MIVPNHSPTPVTRRFSGGARELRFLVSCHRRAFGFTAFIVGVIVALNGLLTPPVYESHLRVLLSDDESRQADTTHLAEAVDREFCQTQVEIVRSRPVALKVVQNLHLGRRVPPRDLTAIFNWIPDMFMHIVTLEWLPSSAEPAPAVKDNVSPAIREAQEKERRQLNLADALLNRIRVQLIRYTTILEISVEDWSSNGAAKIAQGVGEAYLERLTDLRRGSSHQANEFLKERLDETQQRLVKSEDMLRKFEEDNTASHLDAQIRHVVEEVGTRLQDELIATEKSLAEEKNRLELILIQLETARRRIMTGQGNSVYMQLKGQLAEKEAALAKMSLDFTADNPEVQKARAELDSLAKHLQEEAALAKQGQTAATDSVGAELEHGLVQTQQLVRVYSIRRDTIVRQRADLKAQLKVLLGQNTQHAIFMREVDANHRIYDALLLRQKEVALKESTTGAPAQILEAATTPHGPIRPKKGLALFTGLLMGIAAGFIVAYIQEYLNSTLRSRNEIVDLVGLPILGTLPEKLQHKGDVNGPAETLALRYPNSLFAESIKAVRACFKYSVSDSPPRIVMITSSESGEGKSTISANIAISLAQAGERTLLIDCDLRRPRHDAIFNLVDRPGLGQINEQDIVKLVHATEQPNLWVIPSGARIIDPTQILEGTRLRGRLDSLRARFDRIVLDTPPVNPVSDTLMLAPLADIVLLVVCAGEVGQGNVTMALERLKSVQAKVAGVVINNLSELATQSHNYYAAPQDRQPLSVEVRA